jgi:ATP-binding cassette subfamily B protein
MARVNSDSERISELISWGFLDVTWAAINMITALSFMAAINWQLTIIVFLTLPVLLVVANWFQIRILTEYRQVRKVNSRITARYNEGITGVRVVKALGREHSNLDEFRAQSGEMRNAAIKAATLSALFWPCVQIISAFAIGAVMSIGGTQVETGGMTIGGIQAFVSYIIFMMWPVLDLSRVYAEMQQTVASAERVFSLIDSKPEVTDQPNAITVPSIAGEIRFEDVEFYYTADKPVLRDLTLTIQQGETIALVGPTGAGKSTIVNLLCRFYEPKAGKIFLNGHDYTTLTMHTIQSRIGMVLQTPRLFSGSIKENIRYGRLDASDQEVIDAAVLAGLDTPSGVLASTDIDAALARCDAVAYMASGDIRPDEAVADIARALRAGYMAALADFLADVRKRAAAARCDYSLIRTGEPVDAAAFVYKPAAEDGLLDLTDGHVKGLAPLRP